jgi:hypothetical protein
MLIVYFGGILRIRKFLMDSRVEEGGNSQIASNEMGANAIDANVVQNNNTVSLQVTFFNHLKQIAREYTQKAQQQKYTSYNSVEEVCEQLNAYMLKRGIKLGEKTAEELLMAMTSSKCIFVKKTGENTEEILSLIGEFFSGKAMNCTTLEVEPKQPIDLVYYYRNRALTGTRFFDEIYAPLFMPNTVCTCALKELSEISFETVFSDFISLFKNPYEEAKLQMSQVISFNVPKIADKKLSLPTNTWFFFLLNGDETLPQDAPFWSETIELNGVGSKNNTNITWYPMAISQFDELIEGAFEKHFLPLDTWKKLDRVEDYLYQSVQFKIDNILARNIERFTTMQVACGSTQVQAMDAAIALAEKLGDRLIKFKTENGMERINASRILYTEAHAHYQYVMLEDGKQLRVRITVAELYALLMQYGGFIRVGSADIINLRNIENVTTSEVHLYHNISIHIPRGKHAEIKKAFWDFQCEG